MYLIKKEIKIFDMKNPNCKFSNKPIHYMFYNKPILVEKGEPEERIVGVIPDGAYILEREDGFYTDVVFWEEFASTLEFKNYEVQGDVKELCGVKIFEIKNISSIEVG